MVGHRVPLRVYYSIFGALMVLTAVTVWVAFFDLGLFSDVVAMTIAVTKALLVVLYFMHLRYGSHLVWIFAGAGVLWLGLLIGLTVSDYLSRGW
jgi:cytochrome c oxidase subunit IV